MKKVMVTITATNERKELIEIWTGPFKETWESIKRHNRFRHWEDFVKFVRDHKLYVDDPEKAARWMIYNNMPPEYKWGDKVDHLIKDLNDKKTDTILKKLVVKVG